MQIALKLLLFLKIWTFIILRFPNKFIKAQTIAYFENPITGGYEDDYDNDSYYRVCKLDVNLETVLKDISRCRKDDE